MQHNIIILHSCINSSFFFDYIIFAVRVYVSVGVFADCSSSIASEIDLYLELSALNSINKA